MPAGMNDISNGKPRMKPSHSEDLEFLRSIRGRFGSRRMWAVEYEFTGEEIFERRGGRIRKQIRISDIIEIRVPVGRKQMILKTDDSKVTVQIPPSLNEVLQKKSSEMMANMSGAERQHFEEVKQKTISRFKRANLLAGAILVLAMFAIAVLIGWLRQRKILP